MWQTIRDERTTLVDLSVGLESDSPSEPFPPSIERFDHRRGAELLAGRLREIGFGDVDADDFPEEIGLAWEEITAITHAGTHMDAPWHYGPKSGGSESRTIDDVPLEWCIGEAIVLDFTEKGSGAEIGVDEIEAELEVIDHELEEGEIVLVRTGADELWGTADYLTEFPGMGADATEYLVERGVKVIGTDAYGFDKPFAEMGRRYVESDAEEELWPAHFAGRDVEYCQIEKMANLTELPRTGATIVTFPVNIAGGSAGWVRPVALVEEGA
ncbi:cyclase family protein [Natronococcus wangiae]|uniref:cyclase family protein n=1 Tax=Natronococcus wangiae TaxID=3068275 RepID=UPI00273DEF61|nr:cyclase family protein [Natronococcus sp. AD5]